MRYSRQEKLPFINENFNKKIKNKKIILIGCGGVGSVLAELLVRGGFLNLILVDNDLIDETNLQRQNFTENQIGNSKSSSLANRIKSIDKKVKVKVIYDILDKSNIKNICEKSDLILDCSDNFETRELINSYCEINKKNWIYSGAVKTEIITCIFYGEDKLFSKVFSNKVLDEKCCDVGVLASTTFSAASLVYNQTLKYFLGIKDYNLIKLNLWTNKIFEIKIK